MRTQRPLLVRTQIAACLCLLVVGCGGALRPTKFTDPRFDFGFVERVAVLPLDNLSNDQQAGERATRLLITELLASGAVEVVEPGEVRAAADRIAGIDRNEPSAEHVTALGKALDVQAFVLGSVTQSESLRSGAVTTPVVTIDLHMVEAETASTVWAATHTEKGGTAGARILGTGGEPISKTTRACIRRLLKTLVD